MKVHLLCCNGLPVKAYVAKGKAESIRVTNQKRAERRFQDGHEGLDRWTIQPLIVVGKKQP